MSTSASTHPARETPGSPLRICVMSECAHGIGGMQRHTHDLIRGLIEIGHEVDVICPAHETLDPEAYGATWHLVDTPGVTDKRWYHKYRTTFLAADRAAPFDVVHSESTAAHGLLFKPAVRTPIVVKYHGNYLSLFKAHVRRVAQRPGSAPGEVKGFVYMTRRYLTRGNAWIFRSCVSMAPSHEQARDTALSQLVHAKLMHTVPTGIDTEMFRPGDRASLRRSLGLPDGVLFVVAGRLNKEKGFDVAFEALARIASDRPDARLLVLGDGDQRAPLEALAQSLGVAGRALFLGGQPPDRVAEYMAASNVFLFPTRRHEAGPIVLLEGMACGLPTVATRIGGNTEVVEPPDGKSAGLLIRLGSVSDLEAAMRRLLADTQLAASLGARARARILEEYTVERMIERTVGVYRLAIARANGAQRP